MTGFPDDQVDRHRVPLDAELEAWLTWDPAESVRVADFAEGPRGLIPVGVDSEAQSGISIAIRGVAGPWGVLQVHSLSPREYGHGEQDIARAMANIVAQSAERRAGEERLRFHATLLDAVGDAVMATDLDGRIIHWNRQAETLYGWEEDEALERSVVDLLVPDAEAGEALDLWLEMSEGHEWAGEMRALRKDGEIVPVRARLTPVRDEKGVVIGRVSVSSDLSERILLEEKLRQSQKMEALGRLAGGVSHDFNNLLTTISGYTELMLDELSEDAPSRDFAREIQWAAQRATSLTAQLLAFSGRQASLPQFIDPKHVVKGMEGLLGQIVGADITLVVRAEGHLSRILAEPSQIEKVILNLAMNAREAMPLGGTLTISIKNLRLDTPLPSFRDDIPPGLYVVISVQDTGPGIPEEIQPKVFDPFFSTKPNDRGTGLGLSTVFGIVQQSGGRVQMNSVVGQGTTFSVFFPELETDGDGPSHRIRAGVGPAMGKGRTVLVAEDDVSVRALLSRILPRLGYRMVEAANGEEALKQFREHEGRIDLVLTDVIMPVMGGPELAAELKRERADVPVIFMSGYTDNALEKQDLWMETPLLQKPFSVEELMQALGGRTAARSES